MKFKATPREGLALTAACLLICSSIPGQAPTPQENQIHVEIAGLRSDKGQVTCALFASAADFPKRADKAVARTASAIVNRHAFCDFSGVAPGTYAVSVFHE